MSKSAVVLTSDWRFFEALSDTLDESLGIGSIYAGDADVAAEHMQRSGVQTILLDLRTDQEAVEPQRVLERLLEDTGRATVVTVGDQVVPRHVAALADVLGSAHVTLAGGDPRSLCEEERVRTALTVSRPEPVPTYRHLVAGDVELSTFTPEFAAIFDDLLRVAHRNVTLLLVGETGTGKTTLARFVHLRSPRADKPFQNLSCGALPSDLIESELFGHIRGAFTGADRNKIGRFQAAGLGTLLLDEIDVLDPKQQAKLLKVIETGEYEMVGSTETRQSEARLIVASNVNLEELMRKSEFRSDLYYRLNVLEFRLPALRDRPLDIVPLAMSFVEQFCEEHHITIDRVHWQFLEALKQYDWPGNLRELKNHVRRAVLFCENSELTVNDLLPKVIRSQFEASGDKPSVDRGWTLADRVARSEREMLEQALRANGNNRTRTAKALGISRVGLYKKLRRLGMMDSSPKVDAS